MFDYRHIFLQKTLLFGEKISIFVTKVLNLRYFTTFQLPNHLDLQKMIKI